MKRSVFVVLFLLLAFPLAGGPGPQPTPKKKPCRATINDCPDQGCAGDGREIDENLNRRKNIRSDDQTATLRSLTWMKKLDDPESFEKGGSREELTALGEGQKITVMAYLLVAKKETGGESCNCDLQTVAETDNHLVLVTKTTLNKFPLPKGADNKTATGVFHSREKESLTAEYTPRVRLTHPAFTREKIQPLIDHTKKKALLVRVTGLLLFDSEHFLENPLNRLNNWEVHPVLKMEFCSTGETCKANSDDGWKSIED